jgi:hypothetical protein
MSLVARASHLCHAGGARNQHAATVDSCLREDRFEVVLHRVLRDDQAMGEFTSVVVTNEVVKQLRFPFSQTHDSGVERCPFGWGSQFDADGDRGHIARRPPFDPGCAQRYPVAVAQVHSRPRWVRVNALLSSEQVLGRPGAQNQRPLRMPRWSDAGTRRRFYLPAL